MPMQTTSQLLYDGVRNLAMQFTGVHDGSGGETLVTKVDVAELTPIPDTVKITEIEYEVSGGLLRMYWDADDPVEFLALAGVGSFDYRDFGGMVNAGGFGRTGNIKFSTIGFDSGSSYSVKLTMKKKF